MLQKITNQSIEVQETMLNKNMYSLRDERKSVANENSILRQRKVHHSVVFRFKTRNIFDKN